MFLAGVFILAVGLSLIAGPVWLATTLHRRTGTAYALLTIGMLTYIPALVLQVLVVGQLDRALLGVLPVKALALGLLAGFIQEPARLLGYHYLAPGAVTRPHALMIGLGHSLPAAGYTALIATGIGWSLLGYGTERPDNPAALASGAFAEALNGLLPILVHMALSWVVLQVFLRGELFWLFAAIFAHSVLVMMATLLGPTDSWAVVSWWSLGAVGAILTISRLSLPSESETQASRNA